MFVRWISVMLSRKTSWNGTRTTAPSIAPSVTLPAARRQRSGPPPGFAEKLRRQEVKAIDARDEKDQQHCSRVAGGDHEKHEQGAQGEMSSRDGIVAEEAIHAPQQPGQVNRHAGMRMSKPDDVVGTKHECQRSKQSASCLAIIPPKQNHHPKAGKE